MSLRRQFRCTTVAAATFQRRRAPSVASAIRSSVPRLGVDGFAGALAPDLGRDARLERLAECLRDRGGDGHHAVCKHGDSYGTVSSSLIALSRLGRGPSIWRYAAGPPDVTAYRSYELSPARRDG